MVRASKLISLELVEFMLSRLVYVVTKGAEGGVRSRKGVALPSVPLCSFSFASQIRGWSSYTCQCTNSNSKLNLVTKLVLIHSLLNFIKLLQVQHLTRSLLSPLQGSR